MIDKQASHLEFLQREGLDPELDSDGDCTFRHGDRTYCLFTDADDDTYFRLSFIAQWDPNETARALPIANQINQLMKVAKITFVDDTLIISVECFLSMPSDFKGIFGRALECLTTVVDEFRNQIYG